MEYRTEYKKHYSDSVDENLKEAINQLYTDKKIDEKIFRNIFNESLPDDSFEIMLSKRKEFTKNTSELNYEFDQIRKKLNEYMIQIGFTNSMNTKNSIDINKIIIIHQFDLNRPYIMASFGVNQTEIIPLMKRRGFVEKFAVLRLNQVLKEIYGEMRMPEDIDHGYSLVYYNKKTQSFSIDYKFYVNVEVVANEEKMRELVDKIKDLDKIVDKKFHTKLGNSYFNEPKNNASALKLQDKERPTSKQPVVQSVQEVLERKSKEEAKKAAEKAAAEKQAAERAIAVAASDNPPVKEHENRAEASPPKAEAKPESRPEQTERPAKEPKKERVARPRDFSQPKDKNKPKKEGLFGKSKNKQDRQDGPPVKSESTEEERVHPAPVPPPIQEPISPPPPPPKREEPKPEPPKESDNFDEIEIEFDISDKELL